MAHNARVLIHDDMPKLGGRAASILTGIGSLATIAYSAAYLSDLARRRKWERRIENQLSAKQKKKMQTNILENAPIIVMDNQEKKSSLLHSMSKARSRL